MFFYRDMTRGSGTLRAVFSAAIARGRVRANLIKSGCWVLALEIAMAMLLNIVVCGSCFIFRNPLLLRKKMLLGMNADDSLEP